LTGLKARKGFFEMKQNRHTVDQIIAKLRRADIELGKGKKVPEVCRWLEISEQTYYRWRQKYGTMQCCVPRHPEGFCASSRGSREQVRKSCY
jgi:hypothetical protein